MKYVWSFDEDNWQDCNDPAKTIGECIEQATKAANKQGHIFIGEATRIIPKLDMVKALETEEQDILAYTGLDPCGWELYNGETKEVEELEKEVNKVFEKWLTKYDHMPNFLYIINVKEYYI